MELRLINNVQGVLGKMISERMILPAGETRESYTVVIDKLVRLLSYLRANYRGPRSMESLMEGAEDTFWAYGQDRGRFLTLLETRAWRRALRDLPDDDSGSMARVKV